MLLPACILAQEDSVQTKKLTFTGDFRFRLEQDWDSRKPDGTFREDRTRWRYRMRFGFNYRYNSWINFGARIRTGDPMKQQDPQLTLGDGFKEFNTLPIGFEKVFAEFQKNGWTAWLGKNTFPFTKQNELFWSDHVNPEGVFVSKSFEFENKTINHLQFKGGYFVVSHNGSSLADDSYFQAIQISGLLFEQKIELFPTIYYFNQLPNIPDGNETFRLDYTILHLGAKVLLLKQPAVKLGADYYFNLEKLSQLDSIDTKFHDQKSGLVAALSLGNFQNARDWFFRVTYTRLERYAAVDYFAQNDWARWDYRSLGSPDGRLTNYQGLELMVGYVIAENLKVNSRFFTVEQLIPFEQSKENGNRIRLDVDIGF